MKKIFACVGFIMILYSCKNGVGGSPKSTVASFIEASREGDLVKVKKYITRSDVGMLEIGENFLAKFDPDGKGMKDKMMNEFKEKTKDARVDIKDEKIDGDNATVNVEFSHEGKSETRPFSLVKEDGQWKIALLSTGMKNSGANQQDIEEKMKNLNIDSLTGTIGKSMEEGMKEFNKMDKDSLKKIMEQGLKEYNKMDKDSLKKVIEEGMKEAERLQDVPKQ
ncbi:MAG: DUF4878 domain-containing protein [Ferruginibacter sp.]